MLTHSELRQYFKSSLTYTKFPAKELLLLRFCIKTSNPQELIQKSRTILAGFTDGIIQIITVCHCCLCLKIMRVKGYSTSSPDRIGQSAFRVHFLDADIQIHGTRSQALSPSPSPTPREPRSPARELARRLVLCQRHYHFEMTKITIKVRQMII